jgi:hypothetical protein
MDRGTSVDLAERLAASIDERASRVGSTCSCQIICCSEKAQALVRAFALVGHDSV